MTIKEKRKILKIKENNSILKNTKSKKILKKNSNDKNVNIKRKVYIYLMIVQILL